MIIFPLVTSWMWFEAAMARLSRWTKIEGLAGSAIDKGFDKCRSAFQLDVTDGSPKQIQFPSLFAQLEKSF